MNDQNKIDLQNSKVQKLISQFLQLRASSGGLTAQDQHLDEDGFTVFVEGRLGEREIETVFDHLINCSYCLHIAAELTKLNFAFADNELQPARAENEPAKVSEVLSNLLTRIFSGEAVVFAHEETAPDISEQIKKSESPEESKK